jgi:FkbM family methyltransferase
MTDGAVLWRLAWDLWRAARGSAERRSVVAVLAHNLRARVSGAHGEVCLRVAGLTCHAAAHGGELHAFREVFVRRVYERLPDFAPRADRVVLDVGANIGLFALSHARAGARVYAVEPHPAAFARLERNIAANGLRGRITAIPCALGAHEGRARLIGGRATPLTRVAPDQGGTVRLRTLDALVAELGLTGIDLLKLDVEGAEVAVLRGARRVLPTVGRMVLEVHAPALLDEVRELAAAAGLRQVEAADGYAHFRALTLDGERAGVSGPHPRPPASRGEE